MRKRLVRVVAVLACGCTFQFLGCGNANLGEIVATGITNTAVDLSAYFVETAVNHAFRLDG